MSAYIGRYHRVRTIGPRGIGAPYVWDRGRAQDSPRMIPAPYDKGERFKGFTRYGEWWRSPEGIWRPAMRGGAGGTYIAGGYESPRFPLVQATVAASQGLLGLDSNYVYNTSGDAIASRFILPLAETLSSVYFFIMSFTGTAANVNDIDLELRNNSVTVGPSTTLHESKTFNPASTVGWNASTGWTFSLVANTQYWLIIGDADGGVTDLATVLYRTTSWAQEQDLVQNTDVITSDGWSATRTFGGRTASIVLIFSSGRVLGNPITSTATSTGTTNQRGLRFIAPAGMKLFGMIAGTTSANISGLNLWSGARGPSGAADANGTVLLPTSLVSGLVQGRAFESYPTLTQGTTYRLVFTYSGNATTPARLIIGTGADATIRSAMLGGGAWYWAEANGTIDWSNDNTSEFPAVDVIVEDFVAENTQGGGLLLLGAGRG